LCGGPPAGARGGRRGGGGGGGGPPPPPRDSVAARARKTELQRERRRREREPKRAATRASTDTLAGVSPVKATTSNASDAMGDGRASVDVFPSPAAEVVPAAVANAAEEVAGARRTVAAQPRTTLEITIEPTVDPCADDDVPCMKCDDPSPCVDGAVAFVLCSNEDVGDGTPCRMGGHYRCLGLKRMPGEGDGWFCSEACLLAFDETKKTPPSPPGKGKAPASEK
jgi:hypothetical protein